MQFRASPAPTARLAENSAGADKKTLYANAADVYKRQDPARIMMVGDSEHDFEVARALGVRCVLFSGGHQPREVLAATGAPVIDALAQLLPLLAQLAAE